MSALPSGLSSSLTEKGCLVSEPLIVIPCLISAGFAFAGVALLLGAGRSRWSLTARVLIAAICYAIAGASSAFLAWQTDMAPLPVVLSVLFAFFSGGLSAWAVTLYRHERRQKREKGGTTRR